MWADKYVLQACKTLNDGRGETPKRIYTLIKERFGGELTSQELMNAVGESLVQGMKKGHVIKNKDRFSLFRARVSPPERSTPSMFHLLQAPSIICPDKVLRADLIPLEDLDQNVGGAQDCDQENNLS